MPRFSAAVALAPSCVAENALVALHRKLSNVAQVVARDALLGEAPLLCNALNMVVSLHIAISCEHGRLVRGNDHLSVELVVQNSLRNRLAIVGAVTDRGLKRGDNLGE